jgi:two-component system sensor histidine kinase QseC
MKPNPSLRRRLLVMLLSTILTVWVVVLVLVYSTAQHEVEEVFDADMARSARILQTLLLHEIREEREVLSKVREVRQELGEEAMRSYPRLRRILREAVEEEDRERVELVAMAQDAGRPSRTGLTFIARHGDGNMMTSDPTAASFPKVPDGYSGLRLRGEAWRVYSLTDAETGLSVQVGEREAFRAGLVRHITRNTLMPLLVALPVLGIAVWILVGRALLPLQRVAHEVSIRAPDALEPIDDIGTPHEVHSLLAALNKLFGRVGAAIRRERQFTSDAAHELRTPLAALKTHLQVAHNQSEEHGTRDHLEQALSGVDRATHSLEQLLQLARAGAEETRALLDASVDLREVAVGVVSALSQLAFERGIDLGIDAPTAVKARGDGDALQVLLRNLVDNALRYTPGGGTVTVSVGLDDEGPWLDVADDGPGVSAEERERIFGRFHRGPEEQAKGSSGSGLGLSIVQRIADLHDARITLGDGRGGRGLAVHILFPPPAPRCPTAVPNTAAIPAHHRSGALTRRG